MNSIPYSKQTIDIDDIDRVVEVLKSAWLTTGPTVVEFEDAVADYVQTSHGVAFNSGTAALHGAAHAIGLGPGDEVIVPAMTFVATANAAVFCGATPMFVDVNPDTLLMEPQDVLRKISARTKAIFAVDYAGQPCDYVELRQIASSNGLTLVADASHSLGAKWFGRHVAQWVDLACYSFHPVKPITTCEGGMVVTNNERLASALRRFRNHGITSDHHQRRASGTCHYDMQELGFNYRLSEIHCALGLSQLKKLGNWCRQRNHIAQSYRDRLQSMPHLKPLAVVEGAEHSFHLFVIRWDASQSGISRDDAIACLRQRAIEANIHYRPVYQHSFYRRHLAKHPIQCPVAEAAYEEIISLPIFPTMTVDQVNFVVETLGSIRNQTRMAA